MTIVPDADRNNNKNMLQFKNHCQDLVKNWPYSAISTMANNFNMFSKS